MSMRNTLQEAQREVTLPAHEARALTDKIRAALEGIYQLIESAYLGRVWVSLGYATWDDYVRREFGNLSLRPPLEERAEVVQSLRDSGLSTRAIGSATELSEATIRRTLAGASNDAPSDAKHVERSPILGLDGKEYSPSQRTGSPLVNSSESGVLDATLDTPAEDVGVEILDLEETVARRSTYAEKILAEFHGSDGGGLQKSMVLAEKVGSLVSPVSGEMSVSESAYAFVAMDLAAALRQFAYVAKTIAGAQVEFSNDDPLDEVLDDLRTAYEYLAETVAQMKEKQ